MAVKARYPRVIGSLPLEHSMLICVNQLVVPCTPGSTQFPCALTLTLTPPDPLHSFTLHADQARYHCFRSGTLQESRDVLAYWKLQAATSRQPKGMLEHTHRYTLGWKYDEGTSQGAESDFW